MEATYRFKLELFYQNHMLESLTEMMKLFGESCVIGLGGEFGTYDVKFTSHDGSDIDIPVDKLDVMRQILQDEYNKLLEEPKYKGFTITVGLPYRLM